MAIPISAYIDITSKVVQGTVGSRDFSGLVFTKDTMLATVPSAYADIKTDYAAGKPVALTQDGIKECFASDTDIYKYASNYFGYNGGNHAPAVLNVACVLSTGTDVYETALTAYNRVLGQFTNFGACAFIGGFELGAAESGGLLDVATANEGNNCLLVVASTPTNESTYSTALASCTMTHLVIGPASDTDGMASWMCVAWFASVDYTKTDASATIDYKQFAGQTAVVTDLATKQAYDGDHANYIGLVQVNGTDMSFYQTGVNMDGVDTGVVRDRMWMEGEIQAGWFNLNSGVQKVEASYSGAAKVKAMVVDAATKAVENGCILVEKPLDDTQIAQIRSITNDDSASDTVQSTGYYVATSIVKSGNRYVCQYTLVYAKGDHIGKVTGTNYLV